MPRPKKVKEKKVRVPRIKKEKVPRVPKEKKLKRVKKANENFFDGLCASTQNELAQAASNGIISGDIDGWIDTGVLILNGQLSGSLQSGGIPDNKIIVFAGEEAVGKTYYILSIVKNFLDTHLNSGVMFFETEGALIKKMLVDRGIDPSRLYVVPVSTVQEFRTQALRILAKVKATPVEKRQPTMLVLDSLGMLSTTKEMEDSESGSEKSDMTRARLIKATFRTLTLKLGVLKIPLLITNHTYDTQGLFSKKVMSGGCLVEGTKIFALKKQDYVNSNVSPSPISIENLKEGDYVDTLFGLKRIIQTFVFDNKELFKITCEDGSVIECSGEHKFLVNGEWIDTETLFVNVKVDQNINISDLYQGDINVLQQQIQKNLLSDNRTC